MIKILVKMRFGSHLYGTDTPNSDQDFKAVFLPEPHDILLQRAPGAINSNSRIKAADERNQPDDIDMEMFALHKYIGLLCEAQTVALDMLFCPKQHILQETYLWQSIKENQHRFLCREIKAALGYCRTQAKKYGVRGSRMYEIQKVVSFLSNLVSVYGSQARLGEAGQLIQDWINQNNFEHTNVIQLENKNKPGVTNHLISCDRMVPFSASIKTALEVYQKVWENYGERARQAMDNQNVDWKALSHAVRIGHQTIELLNTGHITFPLPNADHIRLIKSGALKYAPVAEEIENLLEQVSLAAKNSKLPDKVDQAWIDEFVADTYYEHIRDHMEIRNE